jgi:hypothetical protein
MTGHSPEAKKPPTSGQKIGVPRTVRGSLPDFIVATLLPPRTLDFSHFLSPDYFRVRRETRTANRGLILVRGVLVSTFI